MCGSSRCSYPGFKLLQHLPNKALSATLLHPSWLRYSALTGATRFRVPVAKFLHQNRSSQNQFSALRLDSTPSRSMDSGMRVSGVTLAYTITLQSSRIELHPDKNTRCLASLFARSALCCSVEHCWPC